MGPRKRPTAHEAFIDDKADDGDYNLPLSDEERPKNQRRLGRKMVSWGSTTRPALIAVLFLRWKLKPSSTLRHII